MQVLLCFLVDYFCLKDIVLKEVLEEWVKVQGLLEVCFEISDKNFYLICLDMGCCLCVEVVEVLKVQCVVNLDVQVVIFDGLLIDAIIVNYEEILLLLMVGLKQVGLKVGILFFVCYGCVKIEDQIGEIFGVKVVILLVGECLGLGQLESFFCYVVYLLCMVIIVEVDCICIFNIYQGGMLLVEVVVVIVDLVKCMLEQKVFGINMI